VLLLVPPSVGGLVLGDTWPLARRILPWTSLEYALLVVGTTAMIGLQARAVGRLLVNVGIGAAGLAISGGVVAAVVAHSAAPFDVVAHSATPFAVAQFVVAGIGTVAVWVLYLRAGRPSRR
jgi:hypothetical protein